MYDFTPPECFTARGGSLWDQDSKTFRFIQNTGCCRVTEQPNHSSCGFTQKHIVESSLTCCFYTECCLSPVLLYTHSEWCKSHAVTLFSGFCQQRRRVKEALFCPHDADGQQSPLTKVAASVQADSHIEYRWCHSMLQGTEEGSGGEVVFDLCFTCIKVLSPQEYFYLSFQKTSL